MNPGDTVRFSVPVVGTTASARFGKRGQLGEPVTLYRNADDDGFFCDCIAPTEPGEYVFAVSDENGHVFREESFSVESEMAIRHFLYGVTQRDSQLIRPPRQLNPKTWRELKQKNRRT